MLRHLGQRPIIPIAQGGSRCPHGKRRRVEEIMIMNIMRDVMNLDFVFFKNIFYDFYVFLVIF